MPTPRPRSVAVLAVFHFIIGILGLLCGAGGLVFLAVNGQKQLTEMLKTQLPDQKEDWEFGERLNDGIEQLLPWHKTYEGVSAVVGLGISLLLIVAGVGLLRIAPWGRNASFLYVALSLALQGAGIAVDSAAVAPAQNRWLDAELQRDPDQKERVEANRPNLAEDTWPALIGFIYPVVVFLVLIRPSIAAAFRGESAGREEGGDFDDRRRTDAYPPGYGGEPDDRIGPARF